jgi:hypothetical protein
MAGHGKQALPSEGVVLRILQSASLSRLPLLGWRLLKYARVPTLPARTSRVLLGVVGSCVGALL